MISKIVLMFLVSMIFSVSAQTLQPKHTFRFIVPSSPGTAPAIYLDIYSKCFTENNIAVLREYKPGGELRVAFNDWVTRKDSENLTNIYLGLSNTNFFADWEGVDFEKDTEVISYMGTWPHVIVSNAEKNYSLNDLREISKSRPITIGISMPMDVYILNKISQKLNIRFLTVNYKTTPIAHNDLLGNHIDLWMGSYPSQKALIDTKKLSIVFSTESEEIAQKNGYESLLKISNDLANMPIGLLISVKPAVPTQIKDLLTSTMNSCNRNIYVINELAKYSGKPLPLSSAKINQLIKIVRGSK